MKKQTNKLLNDLVDELQRHSESVSEIIGQIDLNDLSTGAKVSVSMLGPTVRISYKLHANQLINEGVELNEKHQDSRT